MGVSRNVFTFHNIVEADNQTERNETPLTKTMEETMNTLTFNLKGRSKTFTHTTVEGAYELFLIGYGEVLDELVDVDFLEIDDKGQEHELSMTADTFRNKFRHIEDKVGDNVTETMMKGGA